MADHRAELEQIHDLIGQGEYDTARSALETFSARDEKNRTTVRQVRYLLIEQRYETAQAVLASLIDPTNRHLRRKRPLSRKWIATLLLVVIGGASLAYWSRTTRSKPIEVKDFASAAAELGIEPVAEWQTVERTDITIRLPNRFIPLSTDLTRDLVLELGRYDPQQTTNLVVIDGDDLQSLVPVTFGIVSYQVGSSPETIQDIAEDMYSDDEEEGAKILEKRSVTFESWEGVRVIYKMDDAEYKGVDYVLRLVGRLWIIHGLSPSDVFDNWLPIFEECAGSFQID